jgi:ABC-type multidrug transport system permease subunit
MDESALQTRLDRIERRQRFVLALLVVPYVVGLGELVGYYVAAVAAAVVGVVALALFVASRRGRR